MDLRRDTLERGPARRSMRLEEGRVEAVAVDRRADARAADDAVAAEFERYLPTDIDSTDAQRRLGLAGEALAASELRKNLAAAHERAPIELVVSSPLTRALKTATLGLGSLAIPRTVSPLIAERRYLSSDVGRTPSVLASEFPSFFADAAADSLAERWWWEGSEAEAAATVVMQVGRPKDDTTATAVLFGAHGATAPASTPPPALAPRLGACHGAGC